MEQYISKRAFRGVWKLLAMGALTLAVRAQEVIDQSFVPPDNVVRLDTQIGVAPFYAGAQTFTPAINGQLEGFDFWIMGLGGRPPQAQLQVQVQTTTAQGNPSGNSLGMVILPSSFLDEQPGIYKYIAMDNQNIVLQSGERYAVVFEAVPYIWNGNTAYDFRGYSISQLGGTFSYERGQGMFSEDGRTWREYAGADFDYVFRTYMAIPEPTTVQLAMSGGLLLVLMRRWCCRD